MKSKLILPLLLLFNFAFLLFAQPQIVTEIEISGNRNVSNQKILSLMQVRTGSEFSREAVDTDIRTLAGTGFFRTIGYETRSDEKGLTLILNVEENPIVGSVTIKGNRAFRENRLRDWLGIKKGDPFNLIKLNDGVEEIERQYREKGFHLASVDSSVTEQNGAVNITLDIEEERKTYIREISMEGNLSVTRRELLRNMKLRERSMPFRRGTFTEQLFQQDIERVRKVYADRGFMDAEVSGNFEPHEKGGLLLEIEINEGSRYFLGNISFDGTLLAEEETLREKLALSRHGETLSRKLLNENRMALSSFYMDQGHIRAQVAEIPMPSDTPGYIDITYFIEPGDIFTAGEIKITGNTTTRDKVIRREVAIEPSDKITAEGLKKSFNRLHDLNYFERINIYPEFTHLPGTADLIVDVQEKDKTGMFIIGGGYSSVDDFIGMISVQQTNFDITNPPSFRGAGQNLSLSLELGTEARNYRFSFTEPYFLDRPIWIGPDIYRSRRAWTDFTEQRTGINLRVGRRWENLSLGFGIRTETIDLSDMDIASLVGQEGEQRKNSVTTTLTHSTLDRRRSPSKGNLARVSLETAGGPFSGDVDFLKPVIENNFYRPLGNFTFRSRTYAGMITEFGDTEEIPIYERFFGGGIGTVRGYKERSFGPREDGTDQALGGNALFAQNFELIYPLYEEILKGVFFFDIGNVWEDFGDFDDLRKGIGAGIQVVIPFLNAPIEIYYGYALDQKPGDSSGRVHFGMSFGF